MVETALNEAYAEVVNIPPPPRPEILQQKSGLKDGEWRRY